ncbi:ANTAR domain-containing protein [Rhodobacter sp. Har01]|uniref:ANTAR domain-containing response regulator n=1 Tax=Rhodobacter sp. Har01 TaxID=2883999 RepID=UPI001D08803E|nr:ANTAR domain-containing protein [Rhodobacter sp. Har01]MCB6179948.1 ANTAR domain-containing protein [Rhodobacter sp. Har01]
MSRTAGREADTRKRRVDLSGARVVVCAETDSHFETWMRELRRQRAEVTLIWPPPRRFQDGMDLLICEYFPKVAEVLPWEPGEAGAALVLLLPQSGLHDPAEIAAAAPHGVVSRPFTAPAVVAAAQVAWSQFRYEQRLRERIAQLDENLRSIRFVERAKLILMAEKGMTEPAAYRHLREMAMQQRVSVVEVADAVIRRSELTL